MRGSSGGVISRSWVGPFKPMTCREMVGFSQPAWEGQKDRDMRKPPAARTKLSPARSSQDGRRPGDPGAPR